MGHLLDEGRHASRILVISYETALRWRKLRLRNERQDVHEIRPGLSRPFRDERNIGVVHSGNIDGSHFSPMGPASIDSVALRLFRKQQIRRFRALISPALIENPGIDFYRGVSVETALIVTVRLRTPVGIS